MNKKIIDEALNSLNIKEKFIIIHSNLLSFYKKTYSEPSKVCSIILNNLKGKTIIMPTFTFSINKQKTIHWNYDSTKSESGSLTEYFRKKISLIRTIHPIHSVAIYGPNAKKIPKHNCSSSFGPGSTWEWFAKNKNVCNLSIGIGLDGGATICHYPEEKFKISYRYFKFFKAKILRKNKNPVIKNYSYFARINNSDFTAQNFWKKCENDLIKNKILKRIKISGIIFQKMNCYKAVNFILKKLKQNENYLGRLNKNVSKK